MPRSRSDHANVRNTPYPDYVDDFEQPLESIRPPPPLPSFYAHQQRPQLRQQPLPRYVTAKLKSIDAWGVHRVELTRFDDGPFGFFIAPGQKRRGVGTCFFGFYLKRHHFSQFTNFSDTNLFPGVFISRVSLASLAQVMSVGDEIREVNGRIVKGATLFDVQRMIGEFNTVVLALTPTH